MVKTISCVDGMKGLYTNCRLASCFVSCFKHIYLTTIGKQFTTIRPSCFVSYANEHLSDYHGIV